MGVLTTSALTAPRDAARPSWPRLCFGLALVVCTSAHRCTAGPPPELYDLSGLAVLRHTACHQRSSYDRSGGGDDGYSGAHSILRRENGGAVIFDEVGPGAIYRIWSSNPDGRIKVYFDGEQQPTLDMPWRDMFSGEKQPFIAPFVANLLGGYVSYVPMPFAESCKIVIHGKPVRFYHVTYHTMPSDQSVSTFDPYIEMWDDWEWEDAAEVWRGGGLAMPLDASEALEGETTVAPGATSCIVAIHGAGVVRGLTLELESAAESIGREAILRMYWDGHEAPDVQVPVGDFFLSGFGQRLALALPVGRRGDTYYCRLPMPFEAGARIEIQNASQRAIKRLWWRVRWDADLPADQPLGRFHARWRRQTLTRHDGDFTILSAAGAGHFVGCSLSMQGIQSAGLGFLEGDERIYVDSAAGAADFHGTGTDHYFNGGGYFGGAASTPLYGCTLLDESAGRCAAYRFHITDTVPFASGIRVAIEHGDGSLYPADYASVAYWYQPPAEPPAQPLPPIQARLAIGGRVSRPPGATPAESLLPPAAHAGLRWAVRDYADLGVPVAGRCVLAECQSIGAFITHRLHVPLGGRYRLAAVLGRGPTCGVTSVAVDGVPVGPPFDAYASTPEPPTTVQFGGLPLSAGPHDITLRAVGRNQQARGLDIAIDSFALRDAPDFVNEYMVIGPFPMPSPEHMDRDFGPESSPDLSRFLPGAGAHVGWQPMRTDHRGYLDLAAVLRPRDNVVAYALCHVRSPIERDALLMVGSDDRLKLWLNGLLVRRSMAVRGASPDQDRVPVHLKRGWNRLLAKVGQGTGGWGLYMRMHDPDRVYHYSPHPPPGPLHSAPPDSLSARIYGTLPHRHVRQDDSPQLHLLHGRAGG